MVVLHVDNVAQDELHVCVISHVVRHARLPLENWIFLGIHARACRVCPELVRDRPCAYRRCAHDEGHEVEILLLECLRPFRAVQPKVLRRRGCPMGALELDVSKVVGLMLPGLLCWRQGGGQFVLVQRVGISPVPAEVARAWVDGPCVVQFDGFVVCRHGAPDEVEAHALCKDVRVFRLPMRLVIPMRYTAFACACVTHDAICMSRDVVAVGLLHVELLGLFEPRGVVRLGGSLFADEEERFDARCGDIEVRGAEWWCRNAPYLVTAPIHKLPLSLIRVPRCLLHPPCLCGHRTELRIEFEALECPLLTRQCAPVRVRRRENDCLSEVLLGDCDGILGHVMVPRVFDTLFDLL